MSGQKLQVTLSATDQVSPTIKQVIASLEQMTSSLKLTDAGLTGIEGKMRTAFAATGATPFPTKPITDFNAGLNQVGINLDATGGKVAGTQSKFAAFGQTLMANGTAFGVAGASAFGLFNAIDNLEKVQLRASTSTLRATTATTALSTAELALANAKASGTASTEQIALLEQRVSDSRERVAVTTERATIFQQDYTEALAGLALQIGPQAIALAGSLGQVYNTLSATFAKQGGFIATLRSAYTSLAGSQVASNVAGLSSVPIFKGMATGMNTATVAARGLSTAMKGVLAATGVGLAVVIGTTIFEAFSTGADAAKNSAEGLGTTVAGTGQAMDEFGNIAQTAIKDLPAGFAELNTLLAEVGAKSEEQAKKIGQNLAVIMKGQLVTMTETTAQAAETQKQTLEELNQAGLSKIAEHQNRMKFLKGAIASQKASGVSSPELQDELDAIPAKIDKINSSLKINEGTIQALAPITEAYASGVGALGRNMDINTVSAEHWLQTQVDNKIQTIQELAAMRELAKWHGQEIPASVELSVEAYQKYLAEKLHLIPPTKAGAEAEKEYAEELKKARDAQITSNEELAKAQVAREVHIAQSQLMTTSLAGEAATLTTTSRQQMAFNDIIVAGIVGLNEKAIALHLMADANAVATAQTMAAIAAAGEEVIALTNIGAIYDGSATSLLALVNAKVSGVTAAQTFVTQTALERTTLDATTASLAAYITETEGIVIPPGLEQTLPLLKAIQKEFDATGNAAMTLNQALKAQAAPMLEVLSGATGQKSVKEFRKAFEEIEFGDIPNKLENALEKGGEKIQKFAEKGREAFNLFSVTVSSALVGAIGDKTFDKGIDETIKKIEELSGKGVEGLGPITDALTALTELPMEEAAAGAAKYAPVIALIAENSADGDQSVEDMNEALALFDQITSNTSGPDAMATSIDTLAKSLADANGVQLPSWWDDPKLNKVLPNAKKGFVESQGGETGGAPTGDKPAEVPGPVKATDFDTKKAAIIKEVTDIGLTVVTPTVIPAPNMIAFAQAMNDLLLIPQDFTTKFNAAFVGLVVPAPDLVAFAQAMTDLLLIPADFTAKFNAAFVALIVPAPNTEPFVTGIGVVSTTVLAVATDMSILSTPLAIPAPETSAFTEAFSTLATDATESLQEIVDFLADDLVTAFTEVDSNGIQPYVTAIEEAETTVTDSLQEVVDFLADDLTTAFEDMQSTAESTAEGAANAMDDIGAAAASAEGEVRSLISALNAIPKDITVTIRIKVVGDPSGGVKGGAEGYHGMVDEPTMFLAGESGRERIDIKPLDGPDTSGYIDETRKLQTIPEPGRLPSNPTLSPYTYSQPPAMAGPVGPMVANITIPVYVNGQYQGTTQTTKILRDMGAFLS